MEFLRQSDEVLSVGEFSRRFKMLVKTHIPELWLKGEISGIKTAPSGHIYFTLKDADGEISAVLFKGYARSMRIKLENGMRIFAYGEISIYEARGNYQIVVKAVIPDGEGSLAARFETLKKRLAEEGLFDSDRKLPIPKLPRRVAVITSPSGAAIQDFCRILKRRNWHGEIVVIPSRVQGDGAADEIAQGLKLAQDYVFADGKGFDLAIVMRGGGSLEDLWCFNEEIVARAIADSSLPVISAVGHEIDFTLSDFASDLRAETPSAAAEIISSYRIDAVARLKETVAELSRIVMMRIDGLNLKLDSYSEILRLHSPIEKVRTLYLKLDSAETRLHALAGKLLSDMHIAYKSAELRLAERSPKKILQQKREKLELIERNLELASVENTLSRGFALLRDSNGKYISSVADISDSKPFEVRLADGTISAKKE